MIFLNYQYRFIKLINDTTHMLFLWLLKTDLCVYCFLFKTYRYIVNTDGKKIINLTIINVYYSNIIHFRVKTTKILLISYNK